MIRSLIPIRLNIENVAMWVNDPLPEAPIRTLLFPDFTAFAISLSEFQPESARTATTTGSRLMRAIGVNAL